MAQAAAKATTTRSFGPELFRFLRDLEANNDRTWFNANKDRYEREVRDPALDFVEDFAPRLAEISQHFVADPRPSGGSLFRIHRDTRFSKDKSPYKTHVGIHFRHELAKHAHTPGFYLHLQPGSVFVGVGIWHPDPPALLRIREAIAGDPSAWRRATADGSLRLGGDTGGGGERPQARARRFRPGAPADRGPEAKGLHRVGRAHTEGCVLVGL